MMGRAIARRGAIFVSPGGTYLATNVVAAGTASMSAAHVSSAEPSSCTLTDTAFVVTIRADSVAGRYRDSAGLHEVNL